MFSFFNIASNARISESQIVDIGMVDVRYLKMYNSHSTNEGPIGDLMYRAQRECFDNHNMRVCVSNNFSQQLKGGYGLELPILGETTTPKDYDKTKFVMENKPCTAQEVEHFPMNNDEFHISVPAKEKIILKTSLDSDEVSLKNI